MYTIKPQKHIKIHVLIKNKNKQKENGIKNSTNEYNYV